MMQRDDAFFWEGAREGRLLLRQCSGCGEVAHPPVPMCPHCHSLSWGVLQASGSGTVYAWLVSRHPNRPDEEGRVVALIDLDEGVRIVSNLIDADLTQIVAGLPVGVTFKEVGEHILPQFRILEARA